MARPYSMDLRARVVEAVETGLSRRAAARHFAVSESFVIKLMQRVAATGSAAPSPMGGRKPYALAAHEAVVQELIEAQPDRTLDELRAELASRGIAVGRTSIARFLDHLRLTHKKRRSTPQSRSAPMSPPREPPGATSSRA
jgi:transposase